METSEPTKTLSWYFQVHATETFNYSRALSIIQKNCLNFPTWIIKQWFLIHKSPFQQWIFQISIFSHISALRCWHDRQGITRHNNYNQNELKNFITWIFSCVSQASIWWQDYNATYSTILHAHFIFLAHLDRAYWP